MGKAVCDNQAGLMADGCAIWAEYLHCVDADEPGDGLAEITFEKYGINSFCVSSTLGTSANSGYYQSRCYPYVCGFLPDVESVNFTVGSYSISCLKN